MPISRVCAKTPKNNNDTHRKHTCSHSETRTRTAQTRHDRDHMTRHRLHDIQRFKLVFFMKRGTRARHVSNGLSALAWIRIEGELREVAECRWGCGLPQIRHARSLIVFWEETAGRKGPTGEGPFGSEADTVGSKVREVVSAATAMGLVVRTFSRSSNSRIHSLLISHRSFFAVLDCFCFLLTGRRTSTGRSGRAPVAQCSSHCSIEPRGAARDRFLMRLIFTHGTDGSRCLRLLSHRAEL